jgi:prevent-host-death family protein
MRSVNIAELKNRLSSYLNEVREGEEILIRDRHLPIAKIVPISHVDDLESELVALAASGKARMPETRLPASFWKMPAPRIPMTRLMAALRADRDEE